MATGMSSWIDTATDRAHQAIDWVADLARRGNRRRVRVFGKDGETLFETSLTNTVIALLLALLIFPLLLVVVLVGWLLGYRMEING